MTYLPSSKEYSFITSARALIGEIIRDDVWIVAMPILAQSLSIAEELLTLGAERVLAVGISRGVGVKTSYSPKIKMICLNLVIDGDMMDGIRAAEHALDHLPDHMIREVNHFDPDHQARVIRTIFSTSNTFVDRAVFGCRRARWISLEDKLLIDDFWRDADVHHAPSMITEMNFDSLCAAYHTLDEGSGVVIAGDNTNGWHGGASRTRWANSEEHLKLIIKSLGKECTRVRVMPFIDGVSCSMHGWISPQHSVSLRPCEMLVYKSPNRDTYFDYAGAATNWVPSDHIMTQMRDAVERAADHLRKYYDYHGSFTVDGVATEDVFYPTELNPRFGGALGRMGLSIPELPLLYLHYAMVDDRTNRLQGIRSFDLPQLASLLIKATDAQPFISGMASLKIKCPQEMHLHYEQIASTWRLLNIFDPTSNQDSDQDSGQSSELVEETSHIVKVKWGPSIHGSFVMCKFDARLFSRGEATISIVSALLTQAQRDLSSRYSERS